MFMFYDLYDVDKYERSNSNLLYKIAEGSQCFFYFEIILMLLFFPRNPLSVCGDRYFVYIMTY